MVVSIRNNLGPEVKVHTLGHFLLISTLTHLPDLQCAWLVLVTLCDFLIISLHLYFIEYFIYDERSISIIYLGKCEACR